MWGKWEILEENKMIDNILFTTIVGSHLYGMNTPESDVDYFKLYANESIDILLGTVKDSSLSLHLDDGNDCAVHEIGKTIKYLLTGNINFIQGVTSPLLEEQHNDLHTRLDKIVRDNIAKNCFNSINGLARNNYNKYILHTSVIERRKNTFAGRVQKKCNIVCRELDFGISVLETGIIDYTKHKDIYSITDIEPLFADFTVAFENSSLPEKPDTQEFYEYLLDVRLENL